MTLCQVERSSRNEIYLCASKYEFGFRMQLIDTRRALLKHMTLGENFACYIQGVQPIILNTYVDGKTEDILFARLFQGLFGKIL